MSRQIPSTLTIVLVSLVMAAVLLFAALGALPTSNNGVVTLTSPYVTSQPSTALAGTETKLIPSAVPMPQATAFATNVPVGLPVDDGVNFTATKPGPQQPTPSMTNIPVGLPVGVGAVTKPANGQ